MAIVRFEVIRGGFSSWDTLFAEAAEFASRVGPDRLINISHSSDNGDGVIAVWYWDSPEYTDEGIDK